MSEPREQLPQEAAGDITVGAWADLDQDRSSQDGEPDRDDVVLEPVARPPSLWARIMAALRGGS